MNKQAKFTYNGGINQDVSKSKHPGDSYYDAKNIRIINTDSQSAYSVSNEKGNRFEFILPEPSIDLPNNRVVYGDKNIPFANTLGNELINGELPNTSDMQVIIGHSITRNSIILFSTDNNGFDCIWEVEELLEGSFNLVLLYCRNLSFSTLNPIQGLFNFENENIQKIYWVDGVNQLRFINIKHNTLNGDLENLIDLDSNSVSIVGDYNLSQPVLENITGGGIHTAGVIQYSYNLYKLNGSQTTISPVSELISLDRGSILGGGELNQITGASPAISIEKLDNAYSHIRIYAIKYTSINQIPSISLIVDEKIDTYDNYRFNDDGSIINTLTLSEFLFLGSNPITPKHIDSKDNRLFAANIKDSAYTIDIDTRAYSHNSTGSITLFTGNVIYENNVLSGSNISYNASIPIDSYNYLINDDAINPNFDVYRFHKNGATIGGEGLYFKYELLQKTEIELIGDLKYLKFFKDNEIYRIGIQFYNKLGQISEVKWIADFKAPKGNLEGDYNILKVDIKTAAFVSYINSLNLTDLENPIGYKIVRAERNISDRTILCQGGLTGMMTQTTKDAKNWSFYSNEINRQTQSLNEVKLPIPISRGFTNAIGENSLFPTGHLVQMNEGRSEGDDEIYRDNDSGFKTQQSWQYTKMFQMHSPDILFETGLTFGDGLEFTIKGIAQHTTTNTWVQNIRIGPNTIRNSYKNSNTTIETLNNGYGVFGPASFGCQDGLTNHVLYNRVYNNFVTGNNDSIHRSIYGSPEITERGQGTTPYNGDSSFRYINSLESLITDNYKGARANGSGDDTGISLINTFGGRCLTLVEGDDGVQELDRLSLEELIPNNISNINGLLIAEIVRPSSYIYNGGVYGGMSVENKSRTSYIEIGLYQDITNTSSIIESPGDTFVQNFKNSRLLKTDTEKLDCTIMQLSEIVEHKVETTVNLLNRNDSSLLGWDNVFQPKYEDYNDYNRVYSQDSNLVRRQEDSFKLKPVSNFDTRVISSKLKIPGEIIDSWTDFLENDTMDLDGKYGAINALVNTKDDLYTLQDTGVAKLSINPRIQTQGADGVDIELGRGAVLYDYNYLTTKSGTLNKWSVFSSVNSFYYLDLINKTYMKVGNGIVNLAASKGLHAYFQNNLNVNILKIDNPIIGQGVSGGYDVVNGDAYITVIQGSDSFTVSFNEKTDSFNSFWDFKPSMYINKGVQLLTTDPTNTKLYSHFKGVYNNYYDQYYPSYITLLINPESDVDCIFNNIEYKSEFYINDIDQSNSTITHLTAWNEYQNTSRVQLILGRNNNLRRKFRKWSAIIARNQNSRDRMRNPWLFLKLEIDKTDNTKFVLHDIIINYTV
jgi:hypothetical protein